MGAPGTNASRFGIAQARNASADVVDPSNGVRAVGTPRAWCAPRAHRDACRSGGRFPSMARRVVKRGLSESNGVSHLCPAGSGVVSVVARAALEREARGSLGALHLRRCLADGRAESESVAAFLVRVLGAVCRAPAGHRSCNTTAKCSRHAPAGHIIAHPSNGAEGYATDVAPCTYATRGKGAVGRFRKSMPFVVVPSKGAVDP